MQNFEHLISCPPVLFLIFNRPELTQRVFARIREARPTKLFVAADGPRLDHPGEEQICAVTRRVVDQVDWPCEVKTLFRENNLGCGWAVSSAIDWFFEHVEFGIVLEDDCLPSACFFRFCQELLEYYRQDKRIMHISGNNFQFGQSRSEYSYYFSKYSHNWGWATWRRAWHYFDYDMKSWLEFKRMGMIKTVCEDYYEQLKWTNIFEQAYITNFDSWDCRWLYACWSQNGLSILPDVNLVSNIGFGADSTHTSDINNPVSMLPTSDIWDIKHPPLVVRHTEADAYTFDHIFGGKLMRGKYPCINNLRRKLSKFKGNVKNKLLSR